MAKDTLLKDEEDQIADFADLKKEAKVKEAEDQTDVKEEEEEEEEEVDEACSCGGDHDEKDHEMEEMDDELEEAYYDASGKVMTKHDLASAHYYYDIDGKRVKNDMIGNLSEMNYDKDGKEMSKDEMADAEYVYDKDGKKMKNSMKVEASEVDFAALAEALEIEPTGVSKLQEAFETVLSLRVAEEKAIIEAELKEEAIEAVSALKESFEAEMLEKLDAYSAQVVKEWVEDNKVAIIDVAEADRNARIVEGFKDLFESNNVKIDDTQIDAVAELTAENEKLVESLEAEKNRTSNLTALVESVAKKEEVRKYGLDESVEAKVMNIVEGYDVDDKLEERIASVVDLVRTSMKKKSATNESTTKKDLSEQLDESFVKPETIIVETKKEKPDFNNWLKDIIN